MPYRRHRPRCPLGEGAARPAEPRVPRLPC